MSGRAVIVAGCACAAVCFFAAGWVVGRRGKPRDKLVDAVSAPVHRSIEKRAFQPQPSVLLGMPLQQIPSAPANPASPAPSASVASSASEPELVSRALDDPLAA